MNLGRCAEDLAVHISTNSSFHQNPEFTIGNTFVLSFGECFPQDRIEDGFGFKNPHHCNQFSDYAFTKLCYFHFSKGNEHNI